LFKPNAWTRNTNGTYSDMPRPKISVTNETEVQTFKSTTNSTPASQVRTDRISNSNGISSTNRTVQFGAKSNSGTPVSLSIYKTTNSNGPLTTSGRMTVGYNLGNIFVEIENVEDKTTIKAGVESTLQTPSIGGVSVGSQTTIQVSTTGR